MENFGKIECVTLPKMLVASYEVTSTEPEQTAIAYLENWLKSYDLKVGEKGVRNFGFDCHKGREIPEGCRIYHVYFTVPENVKGDSDIEIKEFSGGNFAKIIIKDPFSCDFPSGWAMLLKWVFENNIENRLGCKSPDDCYSLFSDEETPCLEELYFENGIQYMAMYLPIK